MSAGARYDRGMTAEQTPSRGNPEPPGADVPVTTTIRLGGRVLADLGVVGHVTEQEAARMLAKARVAVPVESGRMVGGV